jgi:hypothetical protein
LSRGEPAPMREMAELFLREATARPDCPETLIAYRVSGCTCFQFGDFAGAHQQFQKTIELYDQARHAGFADRFGQDPRASAEILDACAAYADIGISGIIPSARLFRVRLWKAQRSKRFIGCRPRRYRHYQRLLRKVMT